MKNTNPTPPSNPQYSILFLLCLVGFASTGNAQPLKDWDRGYGGEGWEDCNAAIQTNDLGYLLAGYTSSDSSGDISQPSRDDMSIPSWNMNVRGDYWVLRTNANGNKLWESRYGGNKEDRLWGLVQTIDGGFMLGGGSYSDISGEKSEASRGDADYWIVKIDELGNKEWDKTYGGDSTDILNVLIQTQDGGYMLGGWSISTGWTETDSLGEKSDTLRGNYDWWIVKIDELGEVEWEKSYGGEGREQLSDVVQKSDGSYIIAGGTDSDISGEVESAPRGLRDFWVLHIDTTGNILQEYRYGGDGFDDLNKIIVSSDSTYVLAGSSYTLNPSGDKTDPGFGGLDWWIMKIDTTGDILWQHTFGGSGMENVYSLSQNTVDHYLLGGFTNSEDGTLADNPTKGDNDYWIMYLDPQGNRLWDERYGGNDSESLEQLFQTDDGGYLLAGHSRTDVDQDKTDPSNGGNDFWIVKTLCNINLSLSDTIVCPGVPVTVSAYDPDCLDCTYAWSDLSSNTDSIRTIITNSTKTYGVTLTDGVGCQRIDEIEITVYENPEVNLGANTSICEGMSLELDAGPDGALYQWSTQETVQTITVDTSGTYAVTVTNSDNCAVEDSINLIVHPNPIVELGNDTTLCEGNTLSLDAANIAADINWSNGSNTSLITVQSTDIYSVEVIDVNDCTASDTISVTFLPLPQEITISPLGAGPFCPGNDFEITIENSGNGVLYELFDGNNLSGTSSTGNGGTISLMTDTIYSTTLFNVIASFQGLCTDTLSDSVNVFIGDIESPVIGCRSDTTIIIENGNCNPVLMLASPLQAFDNCGIESIIYNLSGATNASSPTYGMNDASGEVYNPGLTTVTYTVIDNFGNGAFCSFDVEVVDMTLPLMGTTASDIVVECDGSGNINEFNNWLNNNGGATAFDECSEITWTTVPDNPVISDGCGETGTVVVTFVGSDEGGNSVSSIASFTIVDTEPPAFTVPVDITIAANEDPDELNITGDVLDESDACDSGVDNLGERFASYTDVISNSGCEDIITRTWVLTDECGNSTEQVQTITRMFLPPVASLSGSTDICNGDSATITFNLSGHSNLFNVLYSDGAQFLILNEISDGHTIQVQPSTSTNYSILGLVETSAPDCPGTIGNGLEITVNEAPQVSNISTTCDLMNTSYILNFEITGGDASSYFVSGDGGALNGNEFTSNAIAKDSAYLFYIDDANGCGPVEISGVYDCECVTASGTIEEVELNACETASVSLTLSGTYLDGNDLIEFIIHNGTDITIGDTIFYTSNTPELTFQTGMQYGETYFVTAIAGTDDGNGNVSELDACYNMSVGVPIVFHQAPIAIITPTSDTELDCNETSLYLSAYLDSGQSDIAFEWTTFGTGNIISDITDQQIEVDEAGVYFLTVTDQTTGCTATTSIGITKDETMPTVVIAEPISLTCDIQSVQLNATASSTGSAFTYQWTGGIIEEGDQTLTPLVTATGVYSLVITDTTNGCTTEEQIFVPLDNDPPLVDAGAAQQLDCLDTQITLNGNYQSPTNNVNILWISDPGHILSDENTLSPTVDEAGIYILTVTNLDNGCSASSNTSVSFNPDVPEGTATAVTDPKCFGDENGTISILEVIGGTDPFTYSLDGNNFHSDNHFDQLGAGSYTLTVQDANGCEWDTLIHLQTPQELFVDLGENLVIDLGEQVRLEPFINQPVETFIWNFPEIIELAPLVQPANQTTYQIQVFNAGGCVAEDAIQVSVRKDRRVFIPTAFTPNGDGYNDYFSIYTDQSVANIKTLRIFNRWGETLFAIENSSPNMETQGWDGSFKGQDLMPGVYIYFVEIEFFDGRVEIFKGDVTLIR